MTDAAYMKRALALARRGLGDVEPNPAVGCVIVRDGRIVGQGYHHKFGSPHAEVEALRDAGEAARGGTVYVTLEPCPHFGKTPPCDRALIAAGVKRVVMGALDPHPDRAGKGAEHLQEAGIEAALAEPAIHAQCLELIEPFLKRSLTGLPYVIAKWAATVDGAIATATGDSKWISSEASRRIVHQLRGRVDAVVIGIGTALADDPLLTARGTRRRRIARRVVIDPSLRLPLTSQLVRSIKEAPLTLATTDASAASPAAAAMREQGVEVIGLEQTGSADPPTLDLAPLLRHLVQQHEATNLLVEGGGRTIGTMMQQQLVDELQVFIGPRILGDGGAPRPVTCQAPPTKISGGIELKLTGLRRTGDDVLLRYRPLARR